MEALMDGQAEHIMLSAHLSVVCRAINNAIPKQVYGLKHLSVTVSQGPWHLRKKELLVWTIWLLLICHHTLQVMIFSSFHELIQSCGVRRPSVCKLLRKSLLLPQKWLDHYQTCTRWSPDGPASRVCSRSRSKVTWYGHFCDVTKCLLYSTFWRSVSTCTHFTKYRYTLLPVQVSDS